MHIELSLLEILVYTKKSKDNFELIFNFIGNQHFCNTNI